jgi:large subunit ribosomal protein L24
MGHRVEKEVAFPLKDVRLIIPYETTQRVKVRDPETGSWTFPLTTVYRDVVIDNVVMERHTTGIDPFTGIDHGDAEIPKDHQYDPVTGLPIFSRYIAGTRHRIEWPWEYTKEDKLEDAAAIEDGNEDRQSLLQRAMTTLRHPIKSLKGDKKAADAKTAAVIEAKENKLNKDIIDEVQKTEANLLDVRKTTQPKSKDPRHKDAYDETDTTRNIVEAEYDMKFSLVHPPFPDSLFDELRGHIQDFDAESRKNDTAPREKRPRRATEQGMAAREAARAKHTAALRMKTPMQLRWEVEHAKKIKLQKSKPLVQPEQLMAALGRHLGQVQGKKKGTSEEVD